MRDSTVRGIGFGIAACYALTIAWIYARQPQTLAEATGALTASVGAYRVDEQSFGDGLTFFRANQFPAARLAFARADPAHQDPTTQFYIAYSYYREGWGRFYNDQDLFALGLQAIDHAIAVAPRGRVVVSDKDLQMQSGDELKAELEAGLKAPTTFNPVTAYERRRK